MRRWFGAAVLGIGLALLAALLLLLRFAVVTDYLYAALVKDPERRPPAGRVIVAPADGTVLYVKRVRDGIIPEIVKRGVAVPVTDHLKTAPRAAFQDGYLIGIYMNTYGVHVNRAPLSGAIIARTIYNGPHLEMSATETRVILTAFMPGWIDLKKLLGLPPFAIEQSADYILKSARETLAIRDLRGRHLYVIRIADYYVGKILTWVQEGQTVETGQKLGMITWGSQTDLLIEASPGLEARIESGDRVYAGETVLAVY